MSWKYVQYENGKYRTTDQGGGGGAVNDITVNDVSIVDQDGIAELSEVAVSGSYNDLTDQPTIPGDTKVTQENTTESKDYRVLLSGTNDDGTKTEGAHKSTNLKFNPNVGDLQTLKLNGVTIGNNPVFTDANVTQTATVTDEDYEVLFSGTADNTTRTEGAGKSNRLLYNPRWANLQTHKLTLQKVVNQVFNDGIRTAGSTSGSTHYPEKWTYDQSTTREDGGRVVIKVPGAGHENGVYLSINNGSNYSPIALNGDNMLTTQFGADTYIELIYEAEGTLTAYSQNGGASTATQTGIWRILNFYTPIQETIHIAPYSGTTNSNGNLSLTDFASKNVLGANVTNASTYVCVGSNTGNKPMLCFRHTNTNAAVTSTAVSGFVFYSD